MAPKINPDIVPPTETLDTDLVPQITPTPAVAPNIPPEPTPAIAPAPFAVGDIEIPPEPLETIDIGSSPFETGEVGGMVSTTESDPAPFDIDDQFNKLVGDQLPETVGESKGNFGKALNEFARPFIAQGYGSAAALNRGLAAFSTHLDSVSQFIENRGLGDRGKLFEKAAASYEGNAEYWQKRADEVGFNFFDEIVSEAAGGIVPGITTFALDVASGYTFPFAAAHGETEAFNEQIRKQPEFIGAELPGEQNPIKTGLLAAAKTGTLHHMFRVMAPLKTYLKAAGMGTIFGIEHAQVAEEGEGVKEFVKGVAIGAIYARTSPGGRLGLNEVVRGIRSELPVHRDPLAPKPSTAELKTTAERRLAEELPKERRAADRFDSEGNLIDRRAESPFAKTTEEMTDAEIRKAFVTDELTGLPNARGFWDDFVKKNSTHVGRWDMDNLHDLNEVFGYDGSDMMIKEIAKIARREKIYAAREKGDEFITHGDKKTLDKDLPRLQKILDNTVLIITGADGRVYEKTGIGVSYGIEESPSRAEGQQKLDKARRLTQGKRIIGRQDGAGSQLPGLREITPEGRQPEGGKIQPPVSELEPTVGRGGQPPVTGEPLAPPVKPTSPISPDTKVVERPRKFLKTAAEAADIEPELAEAIKNIDPQTYTVQPNKESAALARARIEKDGVDAAVDYLMGDTLPTAEKGATAVTLIDHFQRTGDLGRAVQVTEAYDLQLREAGRFVQAASMWGRLTPQAFIRWGNRQRDAVRKRYGVLDTMVGRKPKSFELSEKEQKEIIELHRKANELPDGPEKSDLTMQMVDVIARDLVPSVSEMFDAFRYQNMLSSPRTQLRNITENINNTFITRPADIVSLGAVDFIKSSLTGKARLEYVSDAFVYQKAAVNSVPNAARIFAETWRSGKFGTLEKPDIGIEAKNAFEQARAAQIPGSLTVVSRFMEAADKFNMALISAGEIARLTKQGVESGPAYHAANEVAESYLYRGKLDPGDPKLSWPSRALAGMGNILLESRKTPGLRTVAKWYIPFVRTPINKAIKMTEFSPLGLIRDPRTLADKEVAARTLTGAVVTAVGAAMALSNESTWAPPSNPNDKALWYGTGRKPYSVKINDSWVPVWYLGPFAMGFALPMAAKHYYEERPESMTDSSVEKLIALTEGTARFIGSQSSTQSLGALFSALSGDIDYTFKSQTGFTVQQVIPASALIRWTNTLIDPVYRHPRGFTEQIEANLPFLSKRLDARVGPFLDQAERDPLNSFLPYDIGKEDPMYESLYPVLGEYPARQRHLSGKIERLAKKVASGEFTPDEGMEKYFGLMEATPKVFKPLEDL